MNEGTLVKQALDMVTNDTFNTEWIATVMFLLSYINMGNHFLIPTLLSAEAFAAECKRKLREMFVKVLRPHSQFCSEFFATSYILSLVYWDCKYAKKIGGYGIRSGRIRVDITSSL